MGSQKQYFSMKESLMHPLLYWLMRLMMPVNLISSLISSNLTVDSNLEDENLHINVANSLKC